VSALTLPDPRVLVLQLGARLHYAVPAVFAEANALQGLYTDACASLGILSVARRRIPTRYRSAGLRRLLGRTLPDEVPPALVRVETLAAIIERLRLPFVRKEVVISTHERLRRRILRGRFDGANCLYCVDNGDLDLMKAARDAGLAVLYEQVICPSVGRILREERRRYPGIELEPGEEVERGIARDIEIFGLVKMVVCGSDFVRDDVLSLAPAAQASVIPYGINHQWLDIPTQTIPGRILFVGTVGLRKGNHYLAEATRLLKGRGLNCDVRVVGPYDAGVISRPEFQGPTYIGQVPRDAIRAEFAKADVFAFPTVAEGSAIVLMEALACGVPVVTTPNSGSQVRDSREGFIVPIRDAGALADRLEQLISDRSLRGRFSQQCRQRAEEFSWRRFGQLLLAATRAALQGVSNDK